MRNELAVVSDPMREVRLRGRQTLHFEKGTEMDLIQLRDSHGRVTLSIEVTDAGPVLRFEGEALQIRAAGALMVEAEDLSLHGRSHLSLTTGGSLDVAAEGDLSSQARVQQIRATLGNVNIAANDDVRIDGERVMVNCD